MNYVWKIYYGKVIMPNPTNIYKQEDDEFWYEQRDDIYTLAPDGTKTDFKPWQSIIGFKENPKLYLGFAK